MSWCDWDEIATAAAPAAPVPVVSTDPLYVLYTSGTTGNPKGIVRDTGGYAVALAWAMRNIYDIGPGDTMFTASDVGWVVGHSFIVYGPLLVGATTVLYEGKPVGTPDAGEFWRTVHECDVKAMFTAPTALRAIRRVDPDLEELPEGALPALQTLFLAGERLDTETWHWANEGLGVPIVDHWWQTETGWPICANPSGSKHSRPRPDRRPCRCPATTCGSSTARGGTSPARARAELRPRGTSRCAFRFRRARSPASGGRPERFREAYLVRSRASTRRGMPDTSTRTATCSSWAAPTTSSTSPGTASRRARSKRCSRSTMPSPSAPSSASHDALKGQRAAGFVTLKAHEHDRSRHARGRTRRPRARAHRTRRRVPRRHDPRAAAQDPIRQDPAQDDARRSSTASRSASPRPSRTPRSSTRWSRPFAAPPAHARGPLRPLGGHHPRQGGLTMSRTATETAPPGGIDYLAEERTPQFLELKRKHRSFVFPLSSRSWSGTSPTSCCRRSRRNSWRSGVGLHHARPAARPRPVRHDVRDHDVVRLVREPQARPDLGRDPRDLERQEAGA